MNISIVKCLAFDSCIGYLIVICVAGAIWMIKYIIDTRIVHYLQEHSSNSKTTVAVQTDDIIYNPRSSESVSDTEKRTKIHWSRKAYMTWRVQHANPFYPTHKCRCVDYWIGPDYEPQYDYDPKFTAVVDNYLVVEVEYDTRMIRM